MVILSPFTIFGLSLLFFVKVSIIILLVFYTIFSLIVLRQVNLMSKALNTPVSFIVEVLAWVNVIFAAAFTYYAFVALQY